MRRFLRLKSWKGTERIVLGGGLIASRIGELSMGRASILLRTARASISSCCSIENHPDEAGLIGAVQLAPTWILAGHDAILAVDIGGTNVRVGVVELNAEQARRRGRGRRLEARALAALRRQADARRGDRPDRRDGESS